MSEPTARRLALALAPLLQRVGGRVLDPDEVRGDDVPLVWDGVTVAHVRLEEPTATAAGNAPAGGLDQLIAEVRSELGEGPLVELSRTDKQRVVRLLEERGAFEYRRSAEQVAEAIGVSRFTVYNYLNRTR